MALCPICSDLLLRHAHSRGSYFYCQRCRLEMPEALGFQKVELNRSTTEAFPVQVVIPRNMRNSIEASAK